MPQILEETVRIAVTVNNADRLKTQDIKKVFSTRRESTAQGITCYNCGKKGHYASVLTFTVFGNSKAKATVNI